MNRLPKKFVLVFKKDGQPDIPYWGLEFDTKEKGQETASYINSILGPNLIEIEHYTVELSNKYLD